MRGPRGCGTPHWALGSLKQQIYWRAPYPVKRWLASLSAWKLDRWRYGPAYEAILHDIDSRTGWSEQQFADYQCAQLREVIQLAAAHVPYYRGLFSEAGVDPASISSPEDLRRVPLLGKQAVRAAPASLLDERRDRGGLMQMHTSGTTGTPLTLYRDEWLNAAAFAYLDARWHSVAGVQRRRDRSVSIGGHLVAAPDRDRPPFWVYNRRWNQLYLSSYHLSERNLGAYVAVLREFGATYIEGYPSSIYAVARHIVDNRLQPVPLRACFTLAETLFDYQREAIRQAYGCRTYDQYGCGEMAVFAAECREGSMHVSPEFGIIEVLDANGNPVAPGETGEFVCTSLINRIQLFIRYRVGDSGSLRSGRCACGSPLPMLGHVEGRVDAVLITRDGRRIGRLDPVFKGARGIAEAQIVQDDYDRFRLRIVPGPDYTEAAGHEVTDSLAQRLGGGQISIELVPAIERTASGKFRAVVCNLPQDSISRGGHGATEPGPAGRT